MRVLITGISGFIGQHAAEALITDGHEIHGLYEQPDSRAKNPLVTNQHVGSLTDYSFIAELIEEVRPEAVIHLGAKSEVALSFDNAVRVSEVNYLGTVGLVEANRHNPDLALFLMASTMETYGDHGDRRSPFTEETPQYPMAPYAVAKLACEKYLAYAAHAYGFPSVVLRQTNSYGRRDNDFFVVERIVSQMVAGPWCKLGEPWPMRNFLFIDDLIELYRVILERQPVGETLVTGPDNAITIGELAETIRAKLDWDGEIQWHTIPPRPGEIPYLSSDPAKAKKRLGWKPRVGLSEGLDRTIDIWQ